MDGLSLWISWRYLWGRRKERFVSLISVISILGVAIGVCALIVVLAVMSGFDKDLKEKIIGNYSHITVESSSGINDYDKVLDKLKKIDHVVAGSPFIQAQALLMTSGTARGIVVRGVDFNLESRVTSFNSYLLSGSADMADGVVIGRELSYLLGVSLGDDITLVNQKGKKFSLLVKGLFNSGMYDYDTNIIYLSLGRAQEIFELASSVTGISVRISKLFLADSVKDKIRSVVGPQFYVRTWMERNKNFFAALTLEKITMFIILTLIVLVAAFNIVSTLVVMVTEKTRDIGVLKAIGMNKGRIRLIFTIEGFLIGLIGTAMGAVSGLGICLLLKKYQFIKLPPDIYYLDRLPVSLEIWPDVTCVIFSALAISLLSTVYPAKKAAGLNPVESLRYE